MMSIFHLAWIIPLCVAVGLLMAAVLEAGRDKQ